MAEYFNFDNLRVEKLALMQSLADNVALYKNTLSGKKLRERFDKAYLNIMNIGLVGANSDNGLWGIVVNGAPLLYSSLKELAAYEHVADFIVNQMRELAGTKEEEKKEDKSKLPVFSNDYFFKGLINQISKDDYGGQDVLLGTGEQENDWNKLDPRDKKGIRGRLNRAAALARHLEKYANSLDESKLNFEGSPFENLADFRNRVDRAISALRTPDTMDDEAALTPLGLRASQWFNNGSGDPFTKDDYQGTYGGYYNEYLPLKINKAIKDYANKTVLKLLNTYTKYLFYWDKSGTGSPIRELYRGKELDYLKSLANKTKLDNLEAKELIGSFMLFELQGKLTRLSKKELDKFGPSMRNRANNFKKINGLEGFYWDPIVQQVVRPINENAVPSDSLDIFDKNNPETLKASLILQNMNTPLSQMTELTPTMKKELEAIAWDAASIFNPEAFTGSAMALRAAYLRGEANPNRSTVEKWIDYGTAGLGGIQGIGDLMLTGKLGYRLYLLGKSIGSVSKFAGLLGASFGAIGAYNAKDSIAKLATDWESLTPLDIENISYGLMGLIGLKSFATARNKQTIGKQANPTITEHSVNITDKNGQTHNVKIDDETAKQILLTRTLGKKKSDIDSEILNIPKMKEAVKKYNESITEPSKKLELEEASINTNSRIYGSNRSGKNRIVQEEQVKNPNAPQYEPVGTKYWSNFWGYIPTGNRFKWAGWQRRAWESTPPEKGKGFFEQLRNFWNPEPIPIKPTETPTGGTSTSSGEAPSGTPSTGGTPPPSSGTPSGGGTPSRIRQVPSMESFKATGKAPSPPKHNMTRSEWKEANKKLYKEIDKKRKFTDLMPEEGTYEFKDLTGNTHTFRLIQRDDDFLLDIKSSNGSSKLAILTLDLVKNGIWENIKESLNTGLRNDISLPANIIRTLLGTAYGWLKQGGRIDRQKIQIYKKYINK